MWSCPLSPSLIWFISFEMKIWNLLLISLSIIIPARSGFPDNLPNFNNFFNILYSVQPSINFWIVFHFWWKRSYLMLWYDIDTLGSVLVLVLTLSSPSTASLLHLLWTDNRRWHNFLLRSSGWNISQNFERLGWESNPFFVIIKGNQNSAACKKIGLIRLSYNWKAFLTASCLCWYRTLLI